MNNSSNKRLQSCPNSQSIHFSLLCNTIIHPFFHLSFLPFFLSNNMLSKLRRFRIISAATTTDKEWTSRLTVLLYLNDGDGVDFDGGATLFLNALEASSRAALQLLVRRPRGRHERVTRGVSLPERELAAARAEFDWRHGESFRLSLEPCRLRRSPWRR